MPIPGTQEIRKPLLEAFRGEAPHSFAINEILELMAGYFGLNLNDLSSGDKNILRSRINEAKSDLKKNGFLYNPSNNTYMITNAGNEVLEDNPDIISDDYLHARKNKPLPVAETFGLEAPVSEPMPEPEEVAEAVMPETIEPEPEPEPEPDTLPEEDAMPDILEPVPEPETFPEEPEMEAETFPEPETQEELPSSEPEYEAEAQMSDDDITLEDEPISEPETEPEEQEVYDEPDLPEAQEEPEKLEDYIENEPAEFENTGDFAGQEFDDAPEEILEPGEEYTEDMPEDTYEPEELQQEDIAPENEPEQEDEAEYSPEPEQELDPETEPQQEYVNDEDEEEDEEDAGLLAAMMPSNRIDDVIAKHNSDLADELLMKTAGLPSDRFEMLVIDLLSKMGYFAFQTARYTTEAAGSDLIHGVILDNKTGANIYIQARKLSPGRTVGRADIQDFVEELADKGGKGIYATTATFSENAKIYANDERIMLIDGVKLANLMIANNFCVNVEKVYEVKAIDTESFSEYED